MVKLFDQNRSLFIPDLLDRKGFALQEEMAREFYEELAVVQSGKSTADFPGEIAPSLLDYSLYVDNQKRHIESVKWGGKIEARVNADSGEFIHAAYMYARTIIEGLMPKHVDTGRYSRSFMWQAVDFDTGAEGSLNNPTPSTVIHIYSTAPYSSALEIRIPRGIIYYAYLKTSRKFRGLVGVRYIYLHKNNGLEGVSHIYSVPVLSIGSNDVIASRGIKPGVKARKKKRKKGARSAVTDAQRRANKEG